MAIQLLIILIFFFEDFSPLDMAIAYGNYAVAHYLASQGLKPNTAKTYQDYRDINKLNYCDYEGFLQHLNNGVAPEMVPAFHIRPYNRKLLGCYALITILCDC